MQGLLTGVLRIFSLVECGSLSRLESGFIGDGCRGLGVCLSPELLFAGLFGCAVAKLCAIFTPGRGEVAVFGSVEVGPGVQDGYIFRRFHAGHFVGSLCYACP